MKYFTYTNIGPRDINEDSFFATIKDGTLYACIADGVGGMDYGDIVSKFATKLFSEELIRFRNNQLQVSNDINERLTKYINDELTGANAATTFTAGVIYNYELYGSHVGDSRIYRIRKGTMRKLTKDHSYVEQLVEEKKITYKNPLICIYDGWNDTIYVDKDTKVMYWWHNSSYKGGLTAMYNADGTPKLYDGDLSKYE